MLPTVSTHPPTHDGQVLQPGHVPPAVPPADDHGNHPLGLPEEVFIEVAFVPPVQVQLLALLHLQRQEQEGGQVVEAPRGQVQLMDKLAVVHQEVQLEAVEVDPLAGDVAPVDPPWGQAGPWGSDVLADGEGEGIQGIALGGMEPFPNLGQQVEEREEIDLCPMQAAVGQP